ncbi:MAG: MBL fold metallo-hydrolase [Thermodesulfobacteriota bacterium]|nr:MBL fold metallo-hydrolase [Thermodesulfobacteriota bacterium]
MQEVYPDIFMITEQGAMGALMPPVNIYVLAGSDGLVFDTGYGRKKILAHLEKELIRIRDTVHGRGGDFNLTRSLPSHSHPDHISGLRFLRDRFDIDVMLTERMTANMNPEQYYRKRGDAYQGYDIGLRKKSLLTFYLKYLQPVMLGTTFPGTVDHVIPEQTTLTINNEPWEVMPAPGHCDDHIFLYNAAKGILFSGDNILRTITTWLGPPRSDLSAYRRTLEQTLALPRLELILSAHGSPITEPRQRIAEILAHRDARTRNVLETVQGAGNSGITIKDITNTLYQGQNAAKRNFADGWIILTLEALVDQGTVNVEKNRFFYNPSMS